MASARHDDLAALGIDPDSVVKLSPAEIREFLATLTPEALASLVETEKHRHDTEPYRGTVRLNRRAVTTLESIARRPRHYRAPSTRLARGPRRRGAGRPAARRVTATRGPPDDDPDPASPKPRLRLVKGAVYAYGCGPCPHCGAILMLYQGGLYCGTQGCPWGEQR